MSFLEGNGTPSMVERCMIRPPSARIGPVTPAGAQGDHRQEPGQGQIRHRDRSANPPSRCCRSAYARTAPRPAARRRASRRRDGGGILGSIGGDARRHLRHQPRRAASGCRPSQRWRARSRARSPTAWPARSPASIGKSVGGSMGSTIGRAIVRGTLGGICGGRRQGNHRPFTRLVRAGVHTESARLQLTMLLVAGTLAAGVTSAVG